MALALCDFALEDNSCDQGALWLWGLLLCL